MKHGVLWLLCLALAAWPAAGLGEFIQFGTYTGEEASYGSLTVDTGVTRLDMGDNLVTDWRGFYSFLARFPYLRQVDMFSTRIEKEQVEELARRFPDITFGWTIGIAEHTVRTDQTAFSTLHTLSTEDKHSEDDFSVLRYCRALRALDIGHNRVRDISFLSDLPHLRVLIIAINNITDISPLAGLGELEYLELFWNEVEDLTPLASCTHLMDLNLVNNHIRDLSPLSSLTNLRRLWLKNCNMSGEIRGREMAKELQKALPACYMDTESTSTAGGWREHPHYDVIYEIFHTDKYIPFADSFPEE